jgi:hypothetical protein
LFKPAGRYVHHASGSERGRVENPRSATPLEITGQRRRAISSATKFKIVSSDSAAKRHIAADQSLQSRTCKPAPIAERLHYGEINPRSGDGIEYTRRTGDRAGKDQLPGLHVDGPRIVEYKSVDAVVHRSGARSN